MKAIYQDLVIAQSDETISIEKDFYFPVTSVNMEYLQKANQVGQCDEHGDACYYDVVIEGKKVLKDVASSFSNPVEASESIKDYIVFKEPIKIIE